jgi:hypothetical protein
VRLQVSYLSLGDQGWLQIANFCVSGVLAIFFAWGLHQALKSGRGSLVGPRLIAAYGLGLIVSGVFVTPHLRVALLARSHHQEMGHLFALHAAVSRGCTNRRLQLAFSS